MHQRWGVGVGGWRVGGGEVGGMGGGGGDRGTKSAT